MGDAEKPIFYLKVDKTDDLGFTCFNHWMETVQYLNCKYYIVCDNEALKERIRKYHEIDDDRFINSYRNQLEPLVCDILSPRWIKNACASLTPIFHSKMNNIGRYWNIDADDTFLFIETKKRCEMLDYAEKIADREKIDMFSIDMWYSQCNGKHWTFGVTYIKNETDILTQLERNKALLMQIYKNGEKSRTHLKNLDGIFTNLFIEGLIKIGSFYPENTFFRYMKKINYWQSDEIKYVRAIENDWTRKIFWNDNLSKFSTLSICSDVKKIDIGVKISDGLTFIKQNKMYDEYYDIMGAVGTSNSYKEMVSVASTFADRGDSHAMIRLGRAYRYGKGVDKDLVEAAKWMRMAADKGEALANSELVQVLLRHIENKDFMYREAFKICLNNKDEAWAKRILPYLYYNGVGVEQDMKMAKKMWIKQNTHGMCGSIKSAFILNPILLEYEDVVLIGTEEEIRLLFSICLQYNIRPDYYLMTSSCEKVPEYCGSPFELGGKKWGKKNGKAFLAFSDVELDFVASECIFYVKNDETHGRKKFRNQLLIRSPALKDNQLLVYIDKNVSVESKFIAPIADIRFTEEINSNSPTGRTMVVYTDDVKLIETLMSNNEVFVDFEPFYTSNTYIFTNFRNKVERIHLAQINERYLTGKVIFDRLGSTYQYLITLDVAVGDQFRVLSKRKGVDYSKIKFIVTESARDLLKVQNIEEIGRAHV